MDAQLDGAALTPQTLRIGAARTARGAARRFLRELRAALEHAARNIRRVAEKQKPRAWSMAVEPGVRVRQKRDAAGADRLLRAGRAVFAGFHSVDDGGAGAGGRREAHRGGLPEAQRGAAGRGGDCWA